MREDAPLPERDLLNTSYVQRRRWNSGSSISQACLHRTQTSFRSSLLPATTQHHPLPRV